MHQGASTVERSIAELRALVNCSKPYSNDAGNHQGISLLEPALLVISAGWRTFSDGMKP